ncbi:putative metallocarboxypeptidase ecm14 [Ceratobasidium sp. 414]|nr:putative metallocarboxypeptidase ecm14 [Ceratobasidium sp. 414]
MWDLRMWPSLLLAPLLFKQTLGYPAQTPLLPTSHPAPTPANYTGYELRRYGITNRQDLVHMIQRLNNDNIDIWQLTPHHVDVHMDTTRPSDALSNRTYVTLPYSFPYTHAYQVATVTVTATTTETTPIPLPDVSSLQNSTFHGAYHTIEEIELFVTALASTYPKLVEVVWLGGSWENRDVFAVRIGKRGGGKRKKGKKGEKGVKAECAAGRSGRGGRGGRGRRRGGWTVRRDFEAIRATYRMIKSFLSWLARRLRGTEADAPSSIRSIYVDNPVTHAQQHRVKDRVVIQGAQHAREWIATSTALYLAHALVAPKNETGSLRHLLDRNDFTIIPVPNPDGYAYTWSTDRLWYKNRMDVLPGTSTPKLDDCKGIDMNRNWGYEWNSSSIDENPCSHWYPGAYPFQAPEVTAIANYIRRTPKIRAFVDLRSYGQKLMYPYSFSCDQIPPHAEDIIEAALGATKSLRETHNVPYTSGASCELLYPAPGNIIDWMYGDAKVKYSYSLMLRDTGTYGFMLPPRWIQPVGEETAAAVQSLVKFIGDLD